MKKIVCFTGHRPNKFSFKYNENNIDCIKLKSLIIKEIEKLYSLGYKTFLTGCTMGVDIWCAEIVLDLKQKYNDIELYCIIPFENQAEKWKNEHKLRYNNILKNCNQKILLQKYFTSDCYIKRNKFLVEKSNVIIGVYDEKYALSGTKNILDYALNMNKKIIIIDPKLLKVFNIKSNF